MTKILKTRAGAYIICKYVVAHVSTLRQNFETGTDVMDLLLFAPNAENRSQMRQTGVGKAFKDMRYSLASNTVYNCCKYAEAVFQDNQAIREALLDENREHEVSGEFTKEGLDAHDAFLAQAIWTRPGYITREDVFEASNEMMRIQKTERYEDGKRIVEEVACGDEGRKTKKPRLNPKMRTLDQEIRVEVVKKLWSIQTDWLNSSRQELRRYFTEILGFLFTEEANAHWKFSVPRSYYGRVSNVEKTKVYKGDELSHIMAVDTQNRETLQRLYYAFPRLKLNCSYNVQVCAEGKGKRKRGRKLQTVKVDREICILECALKGITLFHQAQSHDELMRLVPEALQVVYLMGMALATILEKSSKLVEQGTSIPEILTHQYPLHVMVTAEELRMEIVNESTLHMTSTEYDALLEGADEDKENTNPQNDQLLSGGLLGNAVINMDLI